MVTLVATRTMELPHTINKDQVIQRPLLLIPPRRHLTVLFPRFHLSKCSTLGPTPPTGGGSGGGGGGYAPFPGYIAPVPSDNYGGGGGGGASPGPQPPDATTGAPNIDPTTEALPEYPVYPGNEEQPEEPATEETYGGEYREYGGTLEPGTGEEGGGTVAPTNYPDYFPEANYPDYANQLSKGVSTAAPGKEEMNLNLCFLLS